MRHRLNAFCWSVNDHRDIGLDQLIHFYLNNAINLSPLTLHSVMLYPQNDDSFVTIDSVTSFHPMYSIVCVIPILHQYFVKARTGNEIIRARPDINLSEKNSIFSYVLVRNTNNLFLGSRSQYVDAAFSYTCHCLCASGTHVIPAKTEGPIKMPFREGETRVKSCRFKEACIRCRSRSHPMVIRGNFVTAFCLHVIRSR